MDSSVSATSNVVLPGGDELQTFAVVNSQGAFFRTDINQPFSNLVGASGQGRALAVLHEFAHLLASRYFSHGDSLLAGPSVKYANDMLLDKCKTTIGSYSGTP
jgi:hypothetical protein